jgi:hypothetical protein
MGDAESCCEMTFGTQPPPGADSRGLMRENDVRQQGFALSTAAKAFLDNSFRDSQGYLGAYLDGSARQGFRYPYNARINGFSQYAIENTVLESALV